MATTGKGGSGKSSGRGARSLATRLKTTRKRTLSQQRWLERQLNDPYVQRARDSFSRFAELLPSDRDGIRLLGTSGTVTTLAGVHLGLPRYERRRVDGTWMSDADVNGVMLRLRGMSYDERVASPCIGRERADLVLAGCAILEAFRRAFPCTRLRVADRGLREGILIELMRADGAWQGR
jgi:exopolyphosphatase/guanosine-5'-triphosphate,3'-diphosphate pyrophosphatase